MMQMVKTNQNSNPIFPIFGDRNHNTTINLETNIFGISINRGRIVYYYISILAVILFSQNTIAQTIQTGTLIGIWRTPDTLIAIADTKEIRTINKDTFFFHTRKLLKVNDSTYFTYTGTFIDPPTKLDVGKIIKPLFKHVINIKQGIDLLGNTILKALIKSTNIHKLQNDTAWKGGAQLALMGWENGITSVAVYTINFPFYKTKIQPTMPRQKLQVFNNKWGAENAGVYFALSEFPILRNYTSNFFRTRFPTRNEFCQMIIYGIKSYPDIAGLPIDVLTIAKNHITLEEKNDCN